MGMYRLACGEAEIGELRSRWYDAERAMRGPAWAPEPEHRAHFELVSVQDDEATCIVSASFRVDRPARRRAMVQLIFYVSLLEFFVWTFPGILDHLARVWPWYVLLPIFTAVAAFVILAPIGLLAAYAVRFEAKEKKLVALIEESGVEVKPLAAPRCWVFFPCDGHLVGAAVAVTIAFRLLFLIGALGLVPAAWPLVLLAVAALPRQLIEEYAAGLYAKTHNAHTFWQQRAAFVMARISIFGPILALYCVLGLMLQVTHLYYKDGLRDRLHDIDDLWRHGYYGDLGRYDANTLTQEITKIVNHDGEMFHYFHTSAGHFWGYVASGFAIGLIWLAVLDVSILIDTRRDWLRDWGTLRFRAPSNSFEPSTGNAPLVVPLIGVQWLTAFLANAIGLGILVLGVLWATGLSSVAPAIWFAPFLWYRIALEGVWGDAGSWVARAAFVGIGAPSLLWLLMWLSSLTSPLWRWGTAAISQRPGDRIRCRFEALCRDLGIAAPALLFDDTAAAWPETTVVLPLPRLCTIRVAPVLLNELDDEQLDLVLAHELGHVVKHRRRLWAAQMLSRAALLGPGYLTLLLDYRAMEFEVDAFAAHTTGDRQALTELLERGMTGAEIRARLRLAARQPPSKQRRWHGGRLGRLRWAGSGIRDFYGFFFGSALWGALHPSGSERAAYLHATTPRPGPLEVVEV